MADMEGILGMEGMEIEATDGALTDRALRSGSCPLEKAKVATATATSSPRSAAGLPSSSAAGSAAAAEDDEDATAAAEAFAAAAASAAAFFTAASFSTASLAERFSRYEPIRADTSIVVSPTEAAISLSRSTRSALPKAHARRPAPSEMACDASVTFAARLSCASGSSSATTACAVLVRFTELASVRSHTEISSELAVLSSASSFFALSADSRTGAAQFLRLASQSAESEFQSTSQSSMALSFCMRSVAMAADMDFIASRAPSLALFRSFRSARACALALFVRSFRLDAASDSALFFRPRASAILSKKRISTPLRPLAAAGSVLPAKFAGTPREGATQAAGCAAWRDSSAAIAAAATRQTDRVLVRRAFDIGGE
mmetsp:Transcript_14311/g.42702  ORF Transcript_14311/g.42702 Transcript_14311/m.42702 type:complete len:374 (-) Transcript_14311:65-1186(-)